MQSAEVKEKISQKKQALKKLQEVNERNKVELREETSCKGSNKEELDKFWKRAERKL